MKTNLVRIFALAAIGAAACWAQQADMAEVNPDANAESTPLRVSWAVPIVGVWDVAVTVVNCQTGALIRNIHTVQLYQSDGTFSETTSSGARGSSIGYWYRQQRNYEARYFFFRYNPDGSFASFAKAANTITVNNDGNQFSVKATIQDYDANNNLLSTGCVTQTANRL